MTKQTFLAGLAKLQGALRTNLTEIEAAAYMDVLLPLTDESWVFAINKACGELDKFPTPKQLKDLARMYPSPHRQIEYSENKAGLAYGKDRMKIINRIMEGQKNRVTAKQISDLIDKYPEKCDTLTAEAQRWWDQPDDQPFPESA